MSKNVHDIKQTQNTNDTCCLRLQEVYHVAAKKLYDSFKWLHECLRTQKLNLWGEFYWKCNSR